MKSKMLLATPEGGVGEYTHIVNVGISSNGVYSVYGVLTLEQNGYPIAGSITPQNFENCAILQIANDTVKTNWGRHKGIT